MPIEKKARYAVENPVYRAFCRNNFSMRDTIRQKPRKSCARIPYKVKVS